MGHGLSTCTQAIEAHKYTLSPESSVHPGKTVLLVDTPGFDDTAMHDSTRVFKAISQWLVESVEIACLVGKPYSPWRNFSHAKAKDGEVRRPQVAGFVYLQDITQKRVNNRQNIDFLRLQQLSDAGGDSYSKLVLATYQWPADKGAERYRQCVEREKELETNFWKDLIGKGAKMVRVEDSVHAKELVVEVLKNRHLTFP